MAKILYACSRERAFDGSTEAKLREMCRRLEPDNLTGRPAHKVAVQPQLAYAVMNGANVRVQGDSILLGCLYGDTARWHEPHAPHPDGSYAIFRHGRDCLEVLTDAAGSRTVWYYFDDARFIAATSQRAIAMFLGSFQFDDRAIPWMLANGYMGPGTAWDRRIRCLPPDASLALDKTSWSIRVERAPIVFAAQDRPHARHRELLLEDLRSVMASLKNSAQVSFTDHFLPLSGGHDSRSILCLLAQDGAPAHLKAVTWGLEQNIHRKANDAAVAREVAASMGVPHRYFHTDAGPEPAERVLERFLRCGEGRIDHLSAYTDGLEIWRRLAEDEGCRAIIRGDEGFGWIPLSTEMAVRANIGIALCTDYANLEALAKAYRLPAQELSHELRRDKGETLAGWRDRLYHAYRLPTVLAALSDLKYSYVEIVNPLLARRILRRVRELPDRLRTDKALFKEIVNALSPPVPYASETAVEELDQLVRRSDIAAAVRASLESEAARRVLDEGLVGHLLGAVSRERPSSRPSPARRWRLTSLIPRPVRSWLRERVARPVIDPRLLAFRAALIVRMHELLSSDCAAGQAAEKAAGGTSVARGLAAVS